MYVCVFNYILEPFFLCGQVGAIFVIASISSEDTDQFGWKRSRSELVKTDLFQKSLGLFLLHAASTSAQIPFTISPQSHILKMRPKILNFIGIPVSVLRPHLICFTEFLSALTKKSHIISLKLWHPVEKLSIISSQTKCALQPWPSLSKTCKLSLGKCVVANMFCTRAPQVRTLAKKSHLSLVVTVKNVQKRMQQNNEAWTITCFPLESKNAKYNRNLLSNCTTLAR